MTLEQYDGEIQRLEGELRPMMRRLNELHEMRRKLLASNWIAANNVTPADVQPSWGENIPFCGSVLKLGY